MMRKINPQFSALLVSMFKNIKMNSGTDHLALSEVKNSYLMKKVIHKFSALLV